MIEDQIEYLRVDMELYYQDRHCKTRGITWL